MVVKYWLSIVFCLLTYLNTKSQSVVLHPDTFLKDVARYHPLANRAKLRNDMAAAELL